MAIHYQYHAFLSYSHEDINEVSDISYLLRQIGIENVYFDLRERGSYGQISEALRTAAANSMFFVFFQSQHSGNSKWLEDEARFFMESRNSPEPLRLVVARLSKQNSDLPRAISHIGSEVYRCDFSDVFLDGFIELARILLPTKNDPPRKYGILSYYPAQKDVPARVWQILTKRASKEIKLMGHSMTPVFAEGRDRRVILPLLRDKEVDMSVLLLTPNLPRLQQLTEIQRGLPQETVLSEKIENSLEHIRQIKQELMSSNQHERLKVRVAERIMYSSVSAFDSVAVITQYSASPDVGKNSPAFLVYKEPLEEPSMFSFYLEEFERYWREGRHPEEERRKRQFNASTRILDEVGRAREIREWLDGDSKGLPPPSVLVIYPTYRCSSPLHGQEGRVLCENCMYRRFRNSVELPLKDALSILDQAVDLGVQRFEFSGGGEPMQYSAIDDLLDALESKKKGNPDLRFGLLTNGLHLPESLIPLMASVFSYIRFSYAEGIQGNETLETIFSANLGKFLQHVGANFGSLSIGLKVLVSRRNAGGLVRNIVQLRDRLGGDFSRIDHLRIKAMRSQKPWIFEPDEDTSYRFKNELFDRLYVYRERQWPDNVQVDLDLRYVPDHFRCHLSALLGIVDPNGALLACCNYTKEYQRLKIGDLMKERLQSLWGSDQHLKVASNINAANVCNAANGSPCRFVEYHDILGNPERFRPLYCPPNIEGFV